MSNPNNGLGRDPVPKVLQVKVKSNVTGEEPSLGDSGLSNLTLKLECPVNLFPFTVELKWTTFIPDPNHGHHIPIEIPHTIDIPSDAKPIIEDKNEDKVTTGRYVAFKKIDKPFPQEIKTITVLLRGGLEPEPSEEPIGENVPYRYQD